MFRQVRVTACHKSSIVSKMLLGLSNKLSDTIAGVHGVSLWHSRLSGGQQICSQEKVIATYFKIISPHVLIT